MNSALPRARTAACLAAVFALSAGAVLLTSSSSPVATVWPASAFAVIALMFARTDQRLPLTGAVVVLSALGNVVAGRSPVTSLAFGLADGIEALVVAWWLCRGRSRWPALLSWRDARRLVEAVAMGIVAVGVLVAGAIMLLEDGDFGLTFVRVVSSHAATMLVILPLAMRHDTIRPQITITEKGLHLLLLLGAIALAFRPGNSQQLTFLILPFLLWSSARFSRTWAMWELFGVAAVTTAATHLGLGPFVAFTDLRGPTTIAASAQGFLLVCATLTHAFSISAAHERKALRHIAESEANLLRLIESASSTAFIASDLDGVITMFSPGAEHLLGYSADEIVGVQSTVVFHDPDEIAARAAELGLEPGQEVLTHSPAAEDEATDWTLYRKDGERLIVSVSVSPLLDSDDELSGHLSVMRDVTHRLLAEQALIAALEKERDLISRMREVDTAKTDFVANVSHELRTPLASIIGYTELLEEEVAGQLNPAQRDLVDRIVRNSDRLQRLIEDLLMLGAVENGSFELQKRSMDLRDTVRTAMEDAAHREPDNAIALTCEVPDRPVIIQGDPVQLDRLVGNLLGNALKFTRPGGWVRIVVKHGREGATLFVSDNGIGIPENEQELLFQRFFRSTSSRESQVPGTGLGLSIVQSIADAHGGHVAFESTPGVGTTFRVSFPTRAVIPFPDKMLAG